LYYPAAHHRAAMRFSMMLIQACSRHHGPRFTISLKRGTQILSYPQAAGRLPHLIAADIVR